MDYAQPTDVIVSMIDAGLEKPVLGRRQIRAHER